MSKTFTKTPLRVEDGSIKPDRVLEYPKGCSIKNDPVTTEVAGAVTPTRTQRFRDGKLVAVAGIPITNEAQPIIGDTDE